MASIEYRLRPADPYRMLEQMERLGVIMNGDLADPGPRPPWKMWEDEETGEVVILQWDPEDML